MGSCGARKEAPRPGRRLQTRTEDVETDEESCFLFPGRQDDDYMLLMSRTPSHLPAAWQKPAFS